MHVDTFGRSDTVAPPNLLQETFLESGAPPNEISENARGEDSRASRAAVVWAGGRAAQGAPPCSVTRMVLTPVSLVPHNVWSVDWAGEFGTGSISDTAARRQDHAPYWNVCM